MLSIKGFKEEWSFLSNFAAVKLQYDGIVYPSSEHLYQAMKFNNQEVRFEISQLPTAGAAKRAGRDPKYTEYLLAEWDDIRYNVMYDICLLKFSTAKFKKLLLETGDRYIEETNVWGDTYWGVCKGVGENNLGKILMSIRDLIKENENVNE